MKRWLTGFCIGAITLAGTLQHTHASVVYSYTGSTFDLATGPYNSTMNVSGNFALAAALGPNLLSQSILPLSYAFSDGVNILNNTNSIVDDFIISTDAQGNIIFWDIDLERTPIQFEMAGDTRILISTNRFSGGNPDVTSDVGSISTCLTDNGLGCTSSTNSIGRVVSEGGGEWIGPPIPIPATLPLFATALAGLALMSQRRKTAQKI